MQRTRRGFGVGLAAAGAGASLAARGMGMPASATLAESNPIVVFAKHVQGLSFDELGRRLKSIQVQGVEATLRRGGQIAPNALQDSLGGYVDALAKYDQRIVIAASDVHEVNDENVTYIQQLAKHDIPFFRMKYYQYDFSKPIVPQVDSFIQKAEQLTELCKAEGVVALYQNHAGRKYFGAAVWDLLRVLESLNSDHLKVALDIRHTTLELSQSFEAGYRAIRPFMGATYVKDFDWVDREPVQFPLGQGRSKRLFDLIQKDGFKGPLSLHMEYTDHRDPSQLEHAWSCVENDVRTLQNWLQEGV